MSDNIVKSASFLTLLGGGLTHLEQIKQALSLAPILVAADGGADRALAADLLPDAVIGDMDSLSDAARAVLPEERLHLIAEQDSTDFDKCLRSITAPAILALGFTGGRLDHHLATFTSLVTAPDKVVLVIGEEDICFLSPLTFKIDLPRGTRISLYPMGDVTGRSAGLAYPIDNICLSPSGRIGTSNEVTGPLHLEFDCRKMLIILPSKHLQAVLTVLTQ